MKAVLTGSVDKGSAKPFVAAVAFYPACDGPGSALETDTLILIGEADDWTPAERCAHWRDLVRVNGHVMHMKTYPNALHGFDSLIPPHDYAGHRVGRHPEAEDAIMEVRTFLAERLLSSR